MSEFEKCIAEIETAKAAGIRLAAQDGGGPIDAQAYELGWLRSAYRGQSAQADEKIDALKRELIARIPVVMA